MAHWNLIRGENPDGDPKDVAVTGSGRLITQT